MIAALPTLLPFTAHNKHQTNSANQRRQTDPTRPERSLQGRLLPFEVPLPVYVLGLGFAWRCVWRGLGNTSEGNSRVNALYTCESYK